MITGSKGVSRKWRKKGYVEASGVVFGILDQRALRLQTDSVSRLESSMQPLPALKG